MGTLVFLLRGINVGGSGRLPMATLRSIAEELGMTDVRTYIQSGNLVAGWDLAPHDAGPALQAAIAAEVGFAPAVLVRTAEELQATVDASPYDTDRIDPKALHVTFLDTDAAGALAGVDVDGFAPERVVAVGRDLHLHLPGGIGRSPLAAALARHGPAVDATTRSWRTVTRLAEMAAEPA